MLLLFCRLSPLSFHSRFTIFLSSLKHVDIYLSPFFFSPEKNVGIDVGKYHIQYKAPQITSFYLFIAACNNPVVVACFLFTDKSNI